MKSLKKFKDDAVVVVTEALTVAQRVKRRMIFKRIAPKLKMAKKRNLMRSIPTGGREALARQAKKRFLMMLRSRLRKDIKSQGAYNKQPLSVKTQIDKMVDKLKSTPAMQSRMKQWTKPGGKLYRDVIVGRKERIKKMREKNK